LSEKKQGSQFGPACDDPPNIASLLGPTKIAKIKKRHYQAKDMEESGLEYVWSNVEDIEMLYLA
jgi:hypothetical protein